MSGPVDQLKLMAELRTANRIARIKVRIEGSGSFGEVFFEAPLDQILVISEFAEQWNRENPLHAQPMITIEDASR